MRVLVACEFSGVVRDAFLAIGHDAISCDLLPSASPGPHIQGNALDHLEGGWDLLIAHPPCTFLANSGVRWLLRQHIICYCVNIQYIRLCNGLGICCGLYGGRGTVRDTDRWTKMEEGAAFFLAMLNAPISRIAVENPVMHGHARNIIGRGPDQTIQPWQHGHGETKATCLWLKGLPLLRPSNVVNGRLPRVHFASPSPDRWKHRSITPTGIAAAMAAQWGTLPPFEETK